ncbi:MAG TPA: hypothetical protein VFQ05_18770 [Candidatus Eisenbacteria bacterium]|nr:hypothetical protein [Candidatus Eisenbacteria bacterium]
MPHKKHRFAVRLSLSILALALTTAAFAGEPDSPNIEPPPVTTKNIREARSWNDGFARRPSRAVWLQLSAVWMRVYLGGWLGR